MQFDVERQHITRTLEMVTQLLQRDYTTGMIASSLAIPFKQAESLVAEVKRNKPNS